MVRADLLHLSRFSLEFYTNLPFLLESKLFFFFKLDVISSDQVWRGVDPREGKEDTRLNFQTQMLLLIILTEWLFSFPMLLSLNTLIICLFCWNTKHTQKLSEKTLWRGKSVTKDNLTSAHLIHQVKWLNIIRDGGMSKVCHLKIQAKCSHFTLDNRLA